MIAEKKRPVSLHALGTSGNGKPPYDNSTATQRARILKRFGSCPRLTTIESKDEMGILHPCGRIKELRHQGHLIMTHRVRRPDSNGVYHNKVGMFIYCGLGDFTNIPWEKVVRLLPLDSGYDEMNLDRRYALLKKFIIEKHLSSTEYEIAVKTLCDFLDY